jgi:hypothetical protein
MADKAQTTKIPVKPLVRVEARVAGGALVVSIAGGDAPKVWRADLSRLSAAAFELKDGGGETALVLKTPEGAETVHAFQSRAEAVAGLQAVTLALFAQPAPSLAAHAKPSGFWGRLLKTIFYFLAALISVVLLWALLQTSTPGPGGLPPPSPQAKDGKTGVPLPAEQMFGK